MLRSLPTIEQRKEFCRLFQAAFMEIRALGWSGKAAQAGDLAEIFHETPMEMWGWGGWDPDFLRQRLVQYQAKYHGDWYEGRRDYVKMLDEILGAPPDSQAR